MPAYFKPLRRKIGVLTLVLACVFATGWMRSRTFCELICFRTGSNRFDQIGWQDCYFSWSTDVFDDFVKESVEHLTWNVSSEEGSLGLLTEPQGKWTWTWWGFGVGVLDSTEFVGGQRSVYRFIPFWSIVVPLTLVSAWLLVSKPRAGKPAEKQGSNF